MAFKVYGAGKQSSGGKEIDFDALNKYVVETAQLEERETISGYVSAIVDLGVQKQEPAKFVFNGTEDDEKRIIKEHPGTWFEDGVDPQTKEKVRYRCWEQRPIQCVAIAIDFPDIMLNKGKFFEDGETEEKPLRLWLGGEFYTKSHGRVVGRPFPLKVVKNDETGNWSLSTKSTLYKMAVGAKLIKSGQDFLPERLDELLGKTLLFECQIWFKKGNDGKKYYTEYCRYVSGLTRGMKPFKEFPTEPFVIMFDEENDEENVKQIRRHVVNTMMMAENFEGSKIQKQLEKLGKGVKHDNSEPNAETNENKDETVTAEEIKQEKSKSKEETEEFNDDIPF